MADVITRLRLESGEFDSKIKRASQGLLQMEQDCRKVGGTLAILEDDQKDFVRSLGQMDTVSRTVKGRLSELTSAYTELSVQFRRLTDEEKEGDYGRLLSASLDQLRVRIGDTSSQLADVRRSLHDTGEAGKSSGGVMEQLAQRLTLNIDTFKLFEKGLSAAKAALDVARDAFFASEQNLDEWGRTVESANALYEGFLTSLNTMDVGGFLSRIDEIVTAAKDAYDAIDRLGTMQTIQSPALTSRQSEMQRLQTMLRTGRVIDSPLGGKSYGTDGAVLTQAQKTAIAADLKKLMGEVGGIYRQQLAASSDVIEALYREQASVLGMSVEAFKRGTSSMEVFEKNLELAGKYAAYEAAHTSTVQMNTTAGVVSRSVRDGSVNPYAPWKGWNVFKDGGELYQKIVSAIQQAAGLQNQYIGIVSQSYRGINRAEGGTGGGGRGGSVASVTPKAAGPIPRMQSMFQDEELQRRHEEMGLSLIQGRQIGVKSGYIQQMDDYYASLEKPLSPLRAMQEEVSRLQEAMLEAASPEQWQQLATQLESVKGRMDDFTGASEAARLARQGEAAQKAWSAAAAAVGNVGGALQSIDAPAAQVSGLIAQAIAQIAATYAASLKGTFTPWDWIAGAAAGAATMVSTIAAIKAATAGSYAEGGIVPGNSYTGDRLTAHVNSGELILNAAQQASVAGLLQEARAVPASGGSVSVSSENIRIVLHNAARSRGMSVGEYLSL